jgi:integrase/recombinase XerC
MSKRKEHDEIVKGLRESFPKLTEFELAELSLKYLQSTTAEGAKSGKKAKSEPNMTVGEIIEVLRERLWKIELERPRAKIQEDGSLKIKDTSTYRTYETNWRRLENKYSELPISELTEEIALDFCSEAMAIARARHKKIAEERKGRGLPIKTETGHHAYNRALDVLSTVVNYAIKKGALDRSPLIEIDRKPISESDRHGLSPEQVEEILHSAISGGNDPILDYIMLWTIVETACRSGGLLRLQVGDIDAKECLVRFHEKGGKSRKQPVSPELAEALLALAKSRGSVTSDDPIFRFHPNGNGKGRALSARRFERLWERLREEILWVAEKQVSNHWLRHSTLTWVDRVVSSPAITSKYAGHGPATVTSGYTSARIDEIKQAHSSIFGKRSVKKIKPSGRRGKTVGKEAF